MIAFALHQKYLAAGGEGFLPMLANGNPNADAAFPTLVAKILPAGVKGLVVCGILAGSDVITCLPVQLIGNALHH